MATRKRKKKAPAQAPAQEKQAAPEAAKSVAPKRKKAPKAAAAAVASPPSPPAKPARRSAAKSEPPRREKVYSGDRSLPAPYDNATADRPVSPFFADDSYVTYEGSRIPWWVRVMWIFFWLIALYYVVVLAWPDAQRYF